MYFVCNAASQKICRVRINLEKKGNNYLLNSIRPLSLAKIYAVIGFFLGIMEGSYSSFQAILVIQHHQYLH